MLIKCPDDTCNGFLGIFNPGGPPYDELPAEGVHQEEIVSGSLACPSCKRPWAGTISFRRSPPDQVTAEAVMRIAER